MSAPPRPRRVLMTVDAVGGVWRYAMDLGRALSERGTDIVFACLGPAAAARQVQEAQAIGSFVQLDLPLDWTVDSPVELAPVSRRIAELASETAADLIHLNAPSQAAGLNVDIPVVAVAHSCVVTWFRQVRGTGLPPGWEWQQRINRDGLMAADVVVAPSQSFAELLRLSYPGVAGPRVIHNAARPIRSSAAKQPFVLAAGRWWDDGKNAETLDLAAAGSALPVRMAGAQSGPNGQFRALHHAVAVGELSHDDFTDLIARAAIFCSPSIYEPFGLAPLEAATAGAALVLSDIPTYRELWTGAALFVPARDPAAFRAAFDLLATDAELRSELGRRARKRSGRFTLAAQADATLAAYADATIRHHAARQVTA